MRWGQEGNPNVRGPRIPPPPLRTRQYEPVGSCVPSSFKLQAIVRRLNGWLCADMARQSVRGLQSSKNKRHSTHQPGAGSYLARRAGPPFPPGNASLVHNFLLQFHPPLLESFFKDVLAPQSVAVSVGAPAISFSRR